MVTENLKKIIDQVCRDKGIDKSLLIDAIEEAVRSAVRKKYGSRRDVEVLFNEEKGEIEVFQFRTVVEEVFDEETEILFEDAKKLDPEIEIDDDLGEKFDNIADLGRIAAQSAKQVIIQRMRDAEREVVYNLYKDREGSIVNGIVQRFERGNMVVNLGRTDAILPREGQIPKRSFKQGDRLRAYLQEVRRDSKDSQLVLSRTCNEFLISLFEMEVPEIAEGIVNILGCAREPGFRAKMAVSSVESDVDPVGACVGMKGSRVQNVVQELQGERIDIVPWSSDPARYVYNAMAPAEVTTVIVDEDNRKLLVIVPDDQLSLAIGRQGQNVRLASQLMSWRIDVKSETRYNNLENPGYRTLSDIDGLDWSLADRLFAAGVVSAHQLASLDVSEIAELGRIDEKQAESLRLLAAEIGPPDEPLEQPVREEDAEPEVVVQGGNAELLDGDVDPDNDIDGNQDELESSDEQTDSDQADSDEMNGESGTAVSKPDGNKVEDQGT